MTLLDDAAAFVNARLAAAAGVELSPDDLAAESPEGGLAVARRMVADTVPLEDVDALLRTLADQALRLHRTSHEVECGAFVQSAMVAVAQAHLLGHYCGERAGAA